VTKAEAYEAAWRLGFKGDFSLVDQIYHPEYTAVENNTDMEVDLSMDKSAALALGESIIPGPYLCLIEDSNFLRMRIYGKYKEAEIFQSITTSITYKNGKIITQESKVIELDSDPSEGQDWNWEDYV
jgi:hypothetical protein